ncbi:type II toxin-antitoxin system HicB family antitoxin [Mitsuokella sp.]|uniref:type II toxin-antitoxin system HicB family antitoxin n=1 Tax=Mitsuokella sp. TaxID=2049034 RepID=UPI003D7C6A68
MKYAYPALISWSEEDKVYYVTFPDIEGCFTDGASLPEAIENAGDVLNLMLWTMEHEGEAIPKASAMGEVKKMKDTDIVTLVAADTVAYQKVIDRENNPIKYAREKAGLNIKKLAELLGAPYRTVQDWNAGRRMPPEWVQRLIIEKIESVQ